MQKLQGVFWNTRAVQQLHCKYSNGGRLFRGFSQYRVACGQSRSDLAHKNSQRKVPRTDAHPHTAPGQAQGIGLSGHPESEL